MGWTTTEELIWGDKEHAWVAPGRLQTAGPGAYKIPAFNDTPREFNVQLMSGVDNKVAVHSSKAVGEPPFFLGAITFFALRHAVAAARDEQAASAAGGSLPPAGTPPPAAGAHFTFFSPATSERIRLACADRFALLAIGSEGVPPDGDALECKGSF